MKIQSLTHRQKLAVIRAAFEGLINIDIISGEISLVDFTDRTNVYTKEGGK